MNAAQEMVQVPVNGPVESIYQHTTPAHAMVAMIERVMMNPAADIEKMKELEAMFVRMTDRQAKIDFDEALSQMQGELPVIDRRGKIEIRAKDNKGERNGEVQQSTPYALWEDISEGIKPVLAKYGFSLTFRTGLADDGRVKVTGILARGGHREESTMILQHDATGSKNAVQAIGSSTSYGKRYTASALLNLTSRGEDDDGKAGGAEPKITEGQITALRILIEETKSDLPSFLTYAGVDKIEDISPAKYPEALSMLQTKKNRQAQRQ